MKERLRQRLTEPILKNPQTAYKVLFQLRDVDLKLQGERVRLAVDGQRQEERRTTASRTSI